MLMDSEEQVLFDACDLRGIVRNTVDRVVKEGPDFNMSFGAFQWLMMVLS